MTTSHGGRRGDEPAQCRRGAGRSRPRSSRYSGSTPAALSTSQASALSAALTAGAYAAEAGAEKVLVRTRLLRGHEELVVLLAHDDVAKRIAFRFLTETCFARVLHTG